MNIISRVAGYLFRYKGLFVSTLLMAGAMTALAVAVPWVIQQVLDQMFEHGVHEVKLLLQGTGVIAGLYFVREIFNCIRIRINNTLEQKVILDLRRDLHDKLLELPIAFYDRRKSGDISSRVVEDVQNVERAILDGTEQGSVAILTIVGVGAVMFVHEPTLAAFVFLPLPVLFVMAWKYAKVSRRNWKAVRETSGQLNSLLLEDIQGNRLIHGFALRQREQARFLEISKELERRNLRAMFRWSIQGPAANFTSSLGIVAVVGMGAYLLQTDPSFTKGEFFAFLLYANMFYEPVRQLVGINNLIAAGKASGERVFEVLDHPIAIRDPKEPKPFPRGSVEILFNNVRFSYPERGTLVERLNLEVPAGSVTALVGPTGGGKSTLANLTLRYYEVDEGFVSVGGVNLQDFALADLRGNIGIVSQDPFLFDTSVRENLLLARPNASEEDLEKALSAACALNFVNSLPDKLDTMIGERGIRLSMGEKQRLTIARVLLKNPPVVILDEATSSVDVVTEREIQEGLSNLVKGRTTLVIAHRLSTVRDADQIVFLDHGTIIEKGSHFELLAKGGAYANLCRHQENMIPEGF
ncbi:MAG: ABC transporter ATP-binding protein [Verrucomicrobia bacterium]|nr:ABC transporter ATP-binding protein [Verrucomicrobiota bacterium]